MTEKDLDFTLEIPDDTLSKWQALESYMSKFTAAQFSHGICPACKQEHYPDE